MFDNGEYNTWGMHLLTPFQHQVLRVMWRLCGQASQFQREGNLFKFFQWKLEGTSMHLLRVFYSIAKQNIAYMSEFWFPTQIFRFLKLHYMRWVMGENVCLVGVQHILDGASNFMCWRRMKGNLTKNEEVFNNTYSRGKIRAKSWEFGSLWPTPVIMNPGLGPNKPSLYTLPLLLFGLFLPYYFWLKLIDNVTV